MSEQAFKQSFSNLLSYGNPLSHSLARSQLLNRFGEDALEFVAVAVAVDVTVAVSVDASILFILVLCGIFMLFIYKSIHICLCMKYVHLYIYSETYVIYKFATSSQKFVDSYVRVARIDSCSCV